LILFGTYPVLFVTTGVLDQVVNTDWSCSKVAFGGIANPHGGNFGCTIVSVDPILFGLGLWGSCSSGDPAAPQVAFPHHHAASRDQRVR
jgi:hypothetical protein